MKPCPKVFAHINRYEDRSDNCIAAKLLPGEFYVTQHQEMITTVLGSCVSACIYDPETGVGGMNHFMLPENGDTSGCGESARYGLYAMESLINEILKAGGDKSRLRAKLFGGGKIVENMSDVGNRNISFAREFIRAEGLQLDKGDLGLTYPRKVKFFPHLGKAMVKRLRSLKNDTIQIREREYRASLGREAVSGDIELF